MTAKTPSKAKVYGKDIAARGKIYGKNHIAARGQTYSKDHIAHRKVIHLGKDWVVVSREEWEGLNETLDLLSRPANARRLRSALAQAKVGKLKEREL